MGVCEEEGEQSGAVHATSTEEASFSACMARAVAFFSFQICLRVNVSFSLFPKLVLGTMCGSGCSRRRLPMTTHDKGDNNPG